MAKKTAKTDKIAISPVLLALVFGLLWIVLFPSVGSDIAPPDWGMPIVVGARLFAGFVAGWVVVCAAQVVLKAAWMGATQLYAWTRRGNS
jgi:hypothetical protein